MTTSTIPSFNIPTNLRQSLQGYYMDKIHAQYPETTVEEMTEVVTNNLDEIHMRYDEYDACAYLEAEDHRYFEREINWAEWCKHIFTGVPITFTTEEQRLTFLDDCRDRLNVC